MAMAVCVPPERSNWLLIELEFACGQ
jgi:hypothetical protein